MNNNCISMKYNEKIVAPINNFIGRHANSHPNLLRFLVVPIVLVDKLGSSLINPIVLIQQLAIVVINLLGCAFSSKCTLQGARTSLKYAGEALIATPVILL